MSQEPSQARISPEARSASAGPTTVQRAELAALDDATLAAALARMHVIRKFEEVAEASYTRGLVHGSMHLSIGQ